ncbi:hypothetical protein, partial [Tamlana crocina]|uniref:hypothetical protein n=1 Tax=Tamlana crocina TaxID=393006 RepID=UPI001ADDA7D4
ANLQPLLPILKTFSENFFTFLHNPKAVSKSTPSLKLRRSCGDAKIKSICLIIQAKIQKYFRELICFEVLLHKGSAIASPTLSLSLKAAANIQPNFTLASFMKK